MWIGPAEERESVVAGREESEKNIREKYREIKPTTKESEKNRRHDRWTAVVFEAKKG